MTETESLDYFLCPHMTLSSDSLKKLCVFLPRLAILEIISRVSIPEWAKDWMHGHAVMSEGELWSRISDYIAGYRDFAKVHGGPGGMLGYLKQTLDQIDEPRYRIQEALRGKISSAREGEETGILQASLFLEMARELDEKELEIEAGYDRLNAMEQEFRDILGIGEEDLEQVGTKLSAPLAPDEGSLFYMLGKRIESWFGMLSSGPAVSKPVFIAGFPEVVDEILDIVRAGCERSGKDFSTVVHRLGPIPWSGVRAQTILDDPQLSEVVTNCRLRLDEFLRSAAQSEAREEAQSKLRGLQSAFEELCSTCADAEDAKATLVITVIKNVSAASLPGLPALGPDDDAKGWAPVFLSVEGF